MKTIEINAKIRENLGKKETKKLRVEESVPCVLYGGKENIHFYAHKTAFKDLIYTPNSYIVKLIINNNEHLSVIQDAQYHPVSDEILHIDFYEINQDNPVVIGVPVILNGFAKGVQDGGKLNLMAKKLRVKGLVNNLPDELNVDVTNIKLGQTLKVKELSFENIELIDNPNTSVCSVKLTRAARGAATDEEGADGAEGAEGAAEASES
ncbi:MAG: 50S ribosomal protein L25/general stress protein Ctc [Bacteroidales bacterium]|nr:50S ribosomal protein L25/general stress protein Ctc [Bacteroidales bacterium]